MTDRPEQPEYQRVVEDLRARIRAGNPPVGEQLPSLPELMNQYSVSVTVVRRAIQELRSEGIVKSWQGKGTFVHAVPGPREAPATPAEFETLMRHLTELRSQIQVIGDRVAELEQAVGDLKAVEDRAPQRRKSRPPASV